MAVSPSPDQLVTGTVTSVNPKGLKLDGAADWLNFSKFAPDLVPPMRGQTVTLTLDRQGFGAGPYSRPAAPTSPPRAVRRPRASGTPPSPGWPS
jgi:hypothetical protein